MRDAVFNFNNEVDAFDIQIEDDGRAIVPGEDGPMAEYASVQQLAEFYAQSRDVKPENLKNWVLLENGDVFSYVLRAGVAGVDVCEVEEDLDQIFEGLADRFHALSIARAKEQIMADGSADLTEALVHCTETDIAREVYDAMQRKFDEDDGKQVPEVVDERSDLEKYIDKIEEMPGGLRLVAFIAGLSLDVEKAELLANIQNNRILANVDNLSTICNNTITEAVNEGIGVVSNTDAITVITQTAVGDKDEDAKNRLVHTAHMAGRNRVNVSVDVVGAKHIHHTAEIVSLDDIADIDLFVRDNVPYIVRFDENVDAELEAEREEAAEEEPIGEDEGYPYDDDGFEE